MAFVGPVVAEPAPLARQGTNKVCVGDASCLESLPEEGTPASLRVLEAWFGWNMVLAVIWRLTGLPVMESPSAIIRTWPDDCAEMRDTRVSMTPKKASRERRVAMLIPGFNNKKPLMKADYTTPSRAVVRENL
jgi:hypothetical protein